MAEGYLWWQPRSSPGFDGWVQIVREEFETEDQAIEGEKSRLRAIGREKRRFVEGRGVDVEGLRLRFDCGIVYNPPDAGDERVWAIDHFKERMLEYVDTDEELSARLLQHQRAVHGLEPLPRAADTGADDKAGAYDDEDGPASRGSPADPHSPVVERRGDGRGDG